MCGYWLLYGTLVYIIFSVDKTDLSLIFVLYSKWSQNAKLLA